jgi:neurotrimin
VQIWRLHIRQVVEADRGCYMCQINTEQMKQEVGCLDVNVPPDIDMLRTSNDVTVQVMMVTSMFR